MKKLLLALMVMATLASCGKNNKVSSSANPNGSVSNGLAINQAPVLVAAVLNPSQFGQGQMLTNSSSNQTCGTALLIFNYCYGSNTSMTSSSSGQTWAQFIAQYPSATYRYASGRTVVNSQVDISAKQTELTNILNSATKIDVSGPIYYVTVGSQVYVIDTRYTIQMQPSGNAVINSYGQVQVTDYFVQAI